MPFRILQEENEEIPDATFSNNRTTINKLYEIKDPAPKHSELSELPWESVELHLIAESDENM